MPVSCVIKKLRVFDQGAIVSQDRTVRYSALANPVGALTLRSTELTPSGLVGQVDALSNQKISALALDKAAECAEIFSAAELNYEVCAVLDPDEDAAPIRMIFTGPYLDVIFVDGIYRRYLVRTEALGLWEFALVVILKESRLSDERLSDVLILSRRAARTSDTAMMMGFTLESRGLPNPLVMARPVRWLYPAVGCRYSSLSAAICCAPNFRWHSFSFSVLVHSIYCGRTFFGAPSCVTVLDNNLLPTDCAPGEHIFHTSRPEGIERVRALADNDGTLLALVAHIDTIESMLGRRCKDGAMRRSRSLTRYLARVDENSDFVVRIAHISVMVSLSVLIVSTFIPFDRPLSIRLFSFGRDLPIVQNFFGFLSASGNPLPGTVLTVAITLILLIKRRPLASIVFVTIPLAASLSSSLFKEIVERPRPRFFCEEYPSSCVVIDFSMPSAHAVSATVLYSLATATLTSRARFPLWALVTLLVFGFGISWSRVVLGAHYATDVVAGEGLGSAWALVGIYIIHLETRPSLGSITFAEGKYHENGR
uniref:Phosphatidylglycerophosphatase B n=1 Tax=Rathayibacter sp. FH 236 TaxID=2615183 RepID=A0A5J6SHA1_9MICO|nr:phosphatidylglycerophosphatase B [Rathayibacter sp. FH 236]